MLNYGGFLSRRGRQAVVAFFVKRLEFSLWHFFQNRNVGQTMALRIIHKLNGVNATEKKKKHQ